MEYETNEKQTVTRVRGLLTRRGLSGIIRRSTKHPVLRGRMRGQRRGAKRES